ncbi:MAG: DCC1-like thiol-disulfide oxidoreductase family protein [Planctomycetota bacterium]
MTGGQYSLYRAFLGLYLAVQFGLLLVSSLLWRNPVAVATPMPKGPLRHAFPDVLRWIEQPGVQPAALGSAILASLLLLAGKWDRIAAAALALLWIFVGDRVLSADMPGFPLIGFLLLVHSLQQRAPYGSLDAVGRTDPRGNWRRKECLTTALMVLLVVANAGFAVRAIAVFQELDAHGLKAPLLSRCLPPGAPLSSTLLQAPVPILKGAAAAATLAFALASLLLWIRPTRRMAWGLGFAAQLVAWLVLWESALPGAMILLHLAVFDARWLKGRSAQSPDLVLYDGECGLCHGAVRFLLAEDTTARFQLAPLQGETAELTLARHPLHPLPDSILVRTGQGQWLSESTAAIYLLAGLGGYWRGLSWLLRAVPRLLRDGAYHTIARFRKRLIRKPEGLCPLMPADLAIRFRP